MLSPNDQTLVHHLQLLSDQCFGLSHEATLALEAMTVENNRNLAIGTILPMRERLALAVQLIDVLIALHRLRPADPGQGSGT
ncbi:hypothetical protein [Zhengella mangrovi]|uniref:hypothetical protein n=1 Tax=Zhengella mangrovi TaxID=1982044 RepID=UPI001054DA7E|nr:hypothetical protein [Zhengella mangrovi]